MKPLRPISPKAALRPWQKQVLYWSTSVLWVSGVWWLYFQYAGRLQHTTATETSPWQPVLLKIHGAVAMLFLIGFGSLWIDHIPFGWKQIKHRPTGISLLTVAGVLIVTGWGLYYVGDDARRTFVSLLHWVTGLIAALFFILHVRLARAKTRRAPERSPHV